ncbi:hypothetical protein AVEN_81047-1 [Araneus ventricosus]|uniref:Uncharacterized protein n=1 Tax=Araneus ventricosus TaxID=182803 RepID=A0A4Y2JPV3_ARAVE|nr:hypothetical protein AVEN_81047-1 [Araneus ventricosus]
MRPLQAKWHGSLRTIPLFKPSIHRWVNISWRLHGNHNLSLDSKDTAPTPSPTFKGSVAFVRRAFPPPPHGSAFCGFPFVRGLAPPSHELIQFYDLIAQMDSNGDENPNFWTALRDSHWL